MPSLTSDPWPTTPVFVGYKLVAPGPCVCSTSCVRWKLVCCSCVYHGLRAHLCILPLILTSYGANCFLIFHSLLACSFQGLGLTWSWVFPPFSPFFAPSVVLLSFLSYHSAIPGMVLFDPCLLGLFELATYSSLNDSIWSLDLYSCYFELS